ncbi:MAG: hypothetical protein D6B26_04005, partial [Spirochaetaceae bacterium]
MQLLITVLLLDALLLFLLPVFRLWRSRQARQAEKAEAKVRNAIEVAADEKQLRRKPFTSLKAVFSGLLAMSNNSELPSALNSTIQLIIQKKHIQRKLRRRLSSFQASKRKQAIIFCRLLADEQRFELLTGRLEHEPKAYLRLRIAAILLESDWKGEQQAAKLIMAIVRSFEDAPEFYKTRIVALLNTRADLVARWILSLSKLPSDTWSRIVLLQGLAALPDQQAHHILLEAINSKDSTLSEAGIQIAERWYNDILTSPELQNHFSPKVRAAWSLATLKKCPLSNSNTWLQLLAQAESRKLAISMISSKIDYSTLPSVV